MAYIPLVSTFTSQRNALCRAYEVDRLLLRCFRSDILPDRADHPKFDASQVFGNLYLSERAWRDRVERPDGPDPHETHLDRLFWDATLPRKPICLLGVVGSGKSTLIDYYLRCHCPSKGHMQSEFDKKLVLHFDARTIRDNTDFYHRFFLFLQSEMRERARARGFDLDHAIGRRPSAPQNVRQWVHAALEELTARPAREGPSSHPAYVVLVVDNLDQCSIDVQIRAITEVEQWLQTPTIRLWRAFLPMWPSTFRKLQNHQFNLLRGALTFEIGPISPAYLLENRERVIRESLEASAAAKGGEVGAYMNRLAELARERLMPRIERLANSNLRQVLSLWEALLCGEPALSVWRQDQSDPESGRKYEYELLDALIVGIHDALDHDEHRVANVFAMGAGRVHPRDLLIGPHALQLLAQGRDTQVDLHQALVSLGYAEPNIRSVERSLITFNFVHEEPVGGRHVEYEIHSEVVGEYLALRFEPAYIDNLAMVTPVDSKFLPRMARSRGDRADDFTRRVGTTLAFLEFLRECEDGFCDPKRLTKTTPDAFAHALAAFKLTCLWKKMASRYLDRLQGLRHSGYLRAIDPEWWETTLANPVLTQARSAPEHLTTP